MSVACLRPVQTPKLRTYRPGGRSPGLLVTHLIRDRWERSLVSQAVNLRAGVVVAMGGQMLKSGARVQSLDVALGRQVQKGSVITKQ